MGKGRPPALPENRPTPSVRPGQGPLCHGAKKGKEKVATMIRRVDCPVCHRPRLDLGGPHASRWVRAGGQSVLVDCSFFLASGREPLQSGRDDSAATEKTNPTT